jgi:hypothetical protein
MMMLILQNRRMGILGRLSWSRLNSAEVALPPTRFETNISDGIQYKEGLRADSGIANSCQPSVSQQVFKIKLRRT